MEDPTSEKDFQVTEEVIHSIKLEGSSLTPEEDSKIKEISCTVGETFIKLYGKYMTPEKKEKSKLLPNRIVVLPEDEYGEFRKGWAGRETYVRSFAPAYYTSQGDAIIINEDYVTRMTAITKFVGVSSMDVYSGLIALEAAHYFQNQKLARMFLELGSSYYAQEVLKQLDRRAIFEGINSRRANFYNKIIQKAGDKVHKVFFGASKSDNDKYYVYGVMDESREELLNLFPELKKHKERS